MEQTLTKEINDQEMKLREDLNWQICPLSMLLERINALMEDAENSADRTVTVTADSLGMMSGVLHSAISNLEKML